ncbi:MAG: rhodanese-like domain-containing protein, partial [Acidimicrobiales bacterium]
EGTFRPPARHRPAPAQPPAFTQLYDDFLASQGGKRVFHSIGRQRIQELMEGGAQIIEVLEAEQFRRAHLPGAIHIPAWELTSARADQLERTAPVVVYCFDTV